MSSGPLSVTSTALRNCDSFRSHFRPHTENSTTIVGGMPDYWSTWLDANGRFLVTQLDGSRAPFWLVDGEKSESHGLSIQAYRPGAYRQHVVGRPCNAALKLNYWSDDLRNEQPCVELDIEGVSDRQRAVLIETQRVFDKVISSLRVLAKEQGLEGDGFYSEWLIPFKDVHSYPSSLFI